MIRMALLTILVSTATGGNPIVCEPTSDEPKTIKLGEKQFQEVILANDGDTAELWLSTSMPNGWIPNEDYPVLKREKLKPEELAEIRKKERGAGGVPVAGKPGHFAGRFKVKAKEESNTVVKWTYCKFGDLVRTEKELKSGQIPKPPEFRADMKVEEYSPGMVYQVTIRAHPR